MTTVTTKALPTRWLEDEGHLSSRLPSTTHHNKALEATIYTLICTPFQSSVRVDYNAPSLAFWCFCMYFLNHRSEDIETLHKGADKPTLHSYIKKKIKLLVFRNIFVYLLCQDRCQPPLKQNPEQTSLYEPKFMVHHSSAPWHKVSPHHLALK